MSFLENVGLENFKCFSDREIRLGALTLLAGVNGVGKSSFIQSLLLLRDSQQQGFLGRGALTLNGELAHIGTGEDILFEGAEREEIGIRLAWQDDRVATWRWSYDPSRRVLDPTQEVADSTDLLDRPPFQSHFRYLSAERLSPTSSFPIPDPDIAERNPLGSRGEFTVHFLDLNRDEEIPCPDVLGHSDGYSSHLLHQAEAWLNVIRPGTRLEIPPPRVAMDQVELSYQFKTSLGTYGRSYRPANVGFGLTYVLPVIVALISTPPGGLVIIENPEAHLHPRGQFQIGELCALAASAGIQVIIETHSDHVLNGIRVAVHDKKLAPEDTAVYFFAAGSLEEGPVIHAPKIDHDGRFDSWPDGFFDEWDEALDKLLD